MIVSQWIFNLNKFSPFLYAIAVTQCLERLSLALKCFLFKTACAKNCSKTPPVYPEKMFIQLPSVLGRVKAVRKRIGAAPQLPCRRYKLTL